MAADLPVTAEGALASIDATVDGLCACGCGRILNPAGRSGWWATESCQESWQLARVQPEIAIRRQRVEPTAQEVAESMERFTAAMHEAAQVFLAQAGEAITTVSRQLAPLVAELERSGVLDEAEPTDPRQRALWLRKNRNTGPRQDRQWSVRRLARESRRQS